MSPGEVLFAIVSGFVINECCDLSPWLAYKIVSWSAHRKYIDEFQAEMRAEELQALIDDRPGKLFKLFTALAFAVGAILTLVGRSHGERLLAKAAQKPVVRAILAVTPIIIASIVTNTWLATFGLLGNTAFIEDIAATSGVWVAGMLLAVLVTVPLGLIIGGALITKPTGRIVADFLQIIPAVALIPLGGLLLGNGLTVKLALVMYATACPVMTSTIDGLQGIDPVLTATLRTFGLRRREIFKKITLPAVGSSVVASVRSASSTALMLTISVELLFDRGAGIGVFMNHGLSRASHVDLVLASALWTGVLGQLGGSAFASMGRWLIRDTPSQWRGGNGDDRYRVAGRPQWLLITLGLFVWQELARHADNPFFPPPTNIIRRMYGIWFSESGSRFTLTPSFIHGVLPGLGLALLAWLAAATVGIMGGILISRSHTAFSYMKSLLHFASAIPPVVLLPAFFARFKIGTFAEFAAMMFGLLWPVLLNTIYGMRSLEPALDDTAYVFNFSKFQRLRYLVIPAAGPRIFAGLRLTLSLSLALMVFAEMMTGLSNGIGTELMNAQASFDPTTLWAAILFLGIVGWCLDFLLTVLERRLTGRRHGVEVG